MSDIKCRHCSSKIRKIVLHSDNYFYIHEDWAWRTHHGHDAEPDQRINAKEIE